MAEKAAGQYYRSPVGEIAISEYAGWPPMPKIPGWQQHPYGSVHEYGESSMPLTSSEL